MISFDEYLIMLNKEKVTPFMMAKQMYEREIVVKQLREENAELKEENERLKNEPLTNKISRIDGVVANIYRENEKLKEQLEYLRSGEYFNQLKFERNMLEDIVQKGEISKEDKKFIDMTRRNTELLEENEKLINQRKKAIDYIRNTPNYRFLKYYNELIEILKGEKQ